MANKVADDNVKDLKSPPFWKAVFAEFLGTLILVLVICGTALRPGGHPSRVLEVSLAAGLTVAVVIWIIGPTSGGHINPAVTTAFFLRWKISIVRALFYIIAQCLGAIAAAGILYGVTPDGASKNLGATSLNGVDSGQGFGIEFLITFVFVLVILAVTDESRGLGMVAPVAIGLGLLVGHLFGMRYTGAGMNSARSFGPAVVSGQWDDHWVYWVGPLSGGAVAGIVYELIFSGSGLERVKKLKPKRKAKPADAPADPECVKLEEVQEEPAADADVEAAE